MRVELLYFDGCPSWKQAFANLQEALSADSVSATVELVTIESGAEAQRQRFLGSPSFRVNGEYLWPEERAEYGLGCRVYATPQGLSGAPTVDMLRERLQPFLSHPHR